MDEQQPGPGSVGDETSTLGGRQPTDVVWTRRLRLRHVTPEGPGEVFESASDRLQIGLHPLNDVCLTQRGVSRFHCEIYTSERHEVWIRDLGSRNGTFVDGVRVREAALADGSLLELGGVTFRFERTAERNALQVSPEARFGRLVGTSLAARTVFALLEKAATTDVSILLEGETGTGKTDAASAIHQASTRRDHPFLVVDCGTLPGNLLESELFGHERGAFTGAVTQRVGVFEEADGGTVLLDEVGEVPLDLQPKLLRVLESGEIRKVGTNAQIPVDVRVIAATHRDLRCEVNEGRFRADLYFRLAVLRVTLPSLRQRPEDIPLIVPRLLDSLAGDERWRARLLEPAFVERLSRASWPGNVRELRNHLERCLALEEEFQPDEGVHLQGAQGAESVDLAVPYSEARRRSLEAFDRAYVLALLKRHQGNVARAADAARVDRVHLHRILKRHGLRSWRA